MGQLGAWQYVPHKLCVADALASFMVVDALLLFKRQRKVQVPAILHAGLLLRSCGVVQARAVWHALCMWGRGVEGLYQTMTQPALLVQQLDRLNALSQAYGLPALALRDSALPPGACNVQLTATFPRVQMPLVLKRMAAWDTVRLDEIALEVGH